MDKRTRLVIIIGCIVTFIIVPAVTLFILTKNDTNQRAKNASKVDTSKQTQLPNRSTEELTSAIANSESSLTEGGKPTFAISTVTKPTAGWYVVTIHLLNDPEGTNPAKMLVQDDGDRLSVLLGPGTSFPTETTQSIGVPDVVAEELNK